MKTPSVSFLGSLLVAAALGHAPDARAGSYCPGSCSSRSDCEPGANCFQGNCVFYEDAPAGGDTAAMSAGAGGAAGNAGSGPAGAGGGAGVPGGLGGTGGGCVQDSECQAWWPRSRCVSGVC